MTRIREMRLAPLRHTLAGPYGMAAGPYGMALWLADARQCTRVELEAEDSTSGIGEAWGPPAGVRGHSKAV